MKSRAAVNHALLVQRRKDDLIGYFFIGPWLICFLAFTLIPFVISFLLSVLLALFFSRQFTRPISSLQKVALALAGGRYETRTDLHQEDEIGSLARSMDTLAERLEANPEVRYCPHGRPIYVMLKKKMLETEFGRV